MLPSQWMNSEQAGHTLQIVVLITVGAFAGATLRHLLAVLLPSVSGTFVANVLGCFALGFLAYEPRFAGVLSAEFSLLAGTGFLSSFTTYSTFALETVQAAPVLGIVNVAANYGVGFAAVLLGRGLAARFGSGVDG